VVAGTSKRKKGRREKLAMGSESIKYLFLHVAESFHVADGKSILDSVDGPPWWMVMVDEVLLDELG
jgi:hypothetical protein